MANIELYSIKADNLTQRPIIEQLHDAFTDAGIKPPAPILFDGKIHRFSTDEKNGFSGWYVFFSGRGWNGWAVRRLETRIVAYMARRA